MSQPAVLLPGEWRWKDFPHGELSRVCGGGVRMDPAFMDRLQELREEFALPMVLTSAYREGDPNAHGFGRAVDVGISGAVARRLVALAVIHGFNGIGMRQHGRHDKRFVHLDDLEGAPGRPRPWIWTYDAEKE